MKQFTLKLASLLCILLFGGGSLSAQTLTKITSLDEINETDTYVLQHNGGYGYSGTAYFYAASESAANLSCSAAYNFSTNGYFFNFEKNSDGTFQIKNQYTKKYLTGSTLAFADEPTNDWAIVYNSEKESFSVAYRHVSGTNTYYRVLYAYAATSANSQSKKFDGTKTVEVLLKDCAYTNIYKVGKVETVNVTINYYNEDGTPIVSKYLTPNKGEKTLSDLLESFPTYIDAKYYLVDNGTESEISELSTPVSADATYKVVTSYNSKFQYPKSSEEYFTLRSLHTDYTTYYYLGTSTGITTPTYSNRKSIAVRIEGDWYNGYSIISYDDKKLYLNGSQASFVSDQDYKWKINDENRFVDGTKYLQVKDSYFTTTSWTDFAAKLASTEAATAILETVTPSQPEYVGQLPYETSGLTFDEIMKGVDFTNGTYYFVEKATDASSLLSANPVTTYGTNASAGDIDMSTAKNFSGLWKYEDGMFVHANSGLELTSSGLNETGSTWSKVPTGTDYVYTLSDGTNYLTLNGNSNWKFRIANSMTISLTEKNGTSYATTCAPMPVKLSDDDANTTLYIEKSHTENKISLGKAEVVAANTGIYIENTNAATSVTLLFAESGATSEATSPILAGTTMQLTLPADRTDYRTLGFNKSGEIGFFKPAASIAAIPANRAFLYLNGMSLTNAFYIDFDGTTTSIDELLPDADALDSNAPIYDLSGRRMQGTLHKGIYIQNGRKFMVK